MMIWISCRRKIATDKCYRKTVSDLKLKKPCQWYSCLKSITSYDQLKNEKPSVEEIIHLSDQDQIEVITEQFADTE